jgi:hypothetical protein
MGRKKLEPMSYKKAQNLVQFKDQGDIEEMTDDEVLEEVQSEQKFDQESEIQKRIEEFGNDYDLSDMKVNDKIVLRQLIQAIISLESLEDTFLRERQDVTDKNILILDRIATVMNKLRADISSMQNDLKLTRKIRKESQEENFMHWLDNTKRKAETFYKQKHLFIFCPKCKRLLATTWLLYPDSSNILHLQCENAECKNQFDVRLSDLYDTDNKNVSDVLIP